MTVNDYWTSRQTFPFALFRPSATFSPSAAVVRSGDTFRGEGRDRCCLMISDGQHEPLASDASTAPIDTGNGSIPSGSTHTCVNPACCCARSVVIAVCPPLTSPGHTPSAGVEAANSTHLDMLYAYDGLNPGPPATAGLPLQSYPEISWKSSGVPVVARPREEFDGSVCALESMCGCPQRGLMCGQLLTGGDAGASAGIGCG